ncbi:MAG TPA: hypothetical protein PLG99_00390 [Kaistiaceae bacterium]|nr:hypothetical protein [Kaistiaceae bacterium]
MTGDPDRKEARGHDIAGDAGMIDAVLKAERAAEELIARTRIEAAERREAARARARAIEARAATRLTALRQRYEARIEAKVAELTEKASRETAEATDAAFSDDDIAAAAAAVAIRLTGGEDAPPR